MTPEPTGFVEVRPVDTTQPYFFFLRDHAGHLCLSTSLAADYLRASEQRTANLYAIKVVS